MRVCPNVEIEHYEAQRMDGTSPGRQKQTPKVKTSVPLESQPYPDLELDCVDPCEGCEGSYDHSRGEVHVVGRWIVLVHGGHDCTLLPGLLSRAVSWLLAAVLIQCQARTP